MSKNVHRAKFERNFSMGEYFGNLTDSPSVAEEAFYHQIIVGADLVKAIHEDPVIATFERRAREMFVLSSVSLVECNPSDAGAFIDAQVNARAALKIMSIFSDVMREAEDARIAMKISKDGEDLING